MGVFTCISLQYFAYFYIFSHILFASLGGGGGVQIDYIKGDRREGQNFIILPGSCSLWFYTVRDLVRQTDRDKIFYKVRVLFGL